MLDVQYATGKVLVGQLLVQQYSLFSHFAHEKKRGVANPFRSNHAKKKCTIKVQMFLLHDYCFIIALS